MIGISLQSVSHQEVLRRPQWALFDRQLCPRVVNVQRVCCRLLTRDAHKRKKTEKTQKIFYLKEIAFFLYFVAASTASASLYDMLSSRASKACIPTAQQSHFSVEAFYLRYTLRAPVLCLKKLSGGHLLEMMLQKFSPSLGTQQKYVKKNSQGSSERTDFISHAVRILVSLNTKDKNLTLLVLLWLHIAQLIQEPCWDKVYVLHSFFSRRKFYKNYRDMRDKAVETGKRKEKERGFPYLVTGKSKVSLTL